MAYNLKRRHVVDGVMEPLSAPPGRPAVGFGHYLRDTIYGASDGVVTTLAVIAGVAGASLSPAIALVLGLANLLADGFSMGASNYLGLKSELAQKGEDVAAEMPLRHGGATFAAFVIAGAVPLGAYFLPLDGAARFPAAAVLGLVTLAGVGWVRAPLTGEARTRAIIEMMAIGGLAAAVAFGVGAALDSLVLS